MSNEMFNQLPSVTNVLMSDIICAVQGYISPSSPGTSVQETMQQVFNLMLSSTILNNAGNPNGVVAGNVYQFCWDTTDSILYVCTTSGSATSAVWTQVASSASGIINPAHGGTGVASPTVHTLPIAEGASNFNFVTLTNGQLLIGSTGADPTPSTLTAGSGVTIANSAGTITISTSGGGTSWTDVTGATQLLAVNNGYIADRTAGNVVFTLPTTAAIGDTIYILGRQNGWSIAQNAGQQIIFGTSATTSGTGGSLASTHAADCITLTCSKANVEFTVRNVVASSLTVT